MLLNCLPDVALRRVAPLEERLGRHPLHRQPAVARLAVVVVDVDVARQAKVGDLDDVVLGDEDVPGREVAVDALLGGEELHALADLAREREELPQRDARPLRDRPLVAVVAVGHALEGDSIALKRD